MAAEAILVNGVTEILKKMSFFLAEEINLAWGVKDELRNMKKTLDMILAVMVDAEKKQEHSKSVRLWLEELKDIAYEAEDLLDECSYQVIHQHQLIRKKDKVCNFFSSSNPIVFRLKIAHEIKSINKKFNDIAKRRENLGLQIIELAGMTSLTMNIDESSKIRETYSIVDQSLRIVGRENDKINIINKLLHNNPHNQDENIQVIPIVGMGGLGKTTLAQLIYNDDEVKKSFELKMWVCVSNDFDVKKLFMKIIESITDKKCEDVSIEVIARQLQRHLSGKKYLLVLDDVWNENTLEWERLRTPLLIGGNGSKILVTTRSNKVASIMGGELHSYELGILNENESWSLFKERAFGYVGGAVETPTLTTIGKELVKKCGGLPLAIIFLGSLLRSKKNENEWNAILGNKIWDQSFDENETRILPVLKLSYDYLPPHLKQCLSSFFPLLPKNAKFNPSYIIKLWMAEGFLLQQHEGNSISMEEVGYKYFNSLLCHSFFQDLEFDDIGQVLWCKMHDLVHDLAKYVAGDRECLVFAAHENMETIPNVRRLVLTEFNQGMSKTVCKALQDKTKLRTLFVDGTVKSIENVFDGLKRLRLLDLLNTPNIEAIPSSLISNLKHLRFLRIASTKITSLPKSITRLFHLQTLILRGCDNLKEFPKGIEKLINLRVVLLPEDINMPREIGQLSSLRLFYPINVGGGCGLEVLEGLNLLNDYLLINNLRNVISGIHAQRAYLKGKKNLNQIVLNWQHYGSDVDVDVDVDVAREEEDDGGEYEKDESVLEALQPHPNLKSLSISHYFGARLPWWMGDPSCLPNLVVLYLTKCTKCEQVVGFGKLPSLRMLELVDMDGIKCLGNEFYSSDCGGGGEVVFFPSLKELVLHGMNSLEEWGVDFPSPTVPTVSCFPCLEEIRIFSCPNLRITPTGFPSLKELTLKEINERVAVPIITTNLNSLCVVELLNISELTFLPQVLLQGSTVRVLKVFDCLEFQGFHPFEEEEEDGFTTSLETLSLLRLPNLKFLPDIRRSFTSLEYLYIEDCESFKPLPEDLTCLPTSLENLKRVKIRNVKEVEDFVWWK